MNREESQRTQLRETPHTPVMMTSVDDLDHEALITGASAHPEESPAISKKDRIITLYQSGMTDIAAIVRELGVRPSYVAQVLQSAGLLSGYFDLWSSNSNSSQSQNMYARFFVEILHYKTVEAARESVKQIDRLYKYFERLGDRAGQHHAMTVALIGQNRARWSGKKAQAEIFHEWLMAN